MELSDIYKLSLKYSPPNINIRQAQILDDYGDESSAELIVKHEKPDDVTKKELDYYAWVYPFVEPEGLLFYLYSIVVEYSKNLEVEFVDSFLYSLDRELDGLRDKMLKEDLAVLRHALKHMHKAGGSEYADFAQCLNIQQFINTSIEF